jgi:transcriptional regulator with XRE-family HTH domain
VENKEFLISSLASLKKSIGVTVTALRKKKGYTNYEDFANDHGINRETYRKVEDGKANSTIRTLLRIAIAHGLTVPQLMALVEEVPGGIANSPKE